MKYTSNAQWSWGVYRGMDGSGITSDTHETRKEAEHICRALEREGFGGDPSKRPLRTWVSEVAG